MIDKDNQFYIVKPGGTPSGPLSLDSLKVMARNGALTREHLYCTEGAEEWRPVTELVIIHSATRLVAPVPGGRPAVPRKPSSHLVFSVIMLAFTMMFFQISAVFALVALIFALMAESSYSNGDMVEFEHRARVAKVWCIVSVSVTAGIMFLFALFLHA